MADSQKDRRATLTPVIRYNGKIYKPAQSQGNDFPTHMDALRAVPADLRERATLDANSRGYVNDRGRYMDRFKAQQYAVENQLHDPDKPDWVRTAPELIAEWLKKPNEFADGGSVDLSQYQDSNNFGLYSHAAETAAALPQAKGTPDQFKAMLMKQGVKPVEIDNSNYDDTFAGRPSVTKDELVQHFRQSMPKIQESILSKAPKYANYRIAPSRYNTYALPGGENYREVLLHTDSESQKHEKLANQALDDKREASRRYDAAVPGSPEAQQALQDIRANEALLREHTNKYLKTKDQDYQHGHWPERKNVLSHLRMADRTGPNGEKILHVEELQSDWGQEARASGVRDPRNPSEDDETMVPHNPYITNTGAWTDLALKRVLHEAAHGGYDKVVFTPGEEQADRFDLSNHLSGIVGQANKNGTIDLHLFDHNDEETPFQVIDSIHPDELHKHVGKELADRLMKQIKFPEDQKVWRIQDKAGGSFRTTTTTNFDKLQEFLDEYPENVRNRLEIVPLMEPRGGRDAELRGLDLKVGGEGMKKFYDKIIPDQLNALVKKHDPQVRMRRDSIETPQGPQSVNALDITPTMRDSILRGQKAFSTGGEVDDDDGIIAYHGSPYDFERFDLSKIGTNQGTAYGHGLYFAGAEPVAQNYRGDPEERYRRFSGHMDPKEEYAFDLASRSGDVRDFDVMTGLAQKYGDNIDFDEAARLARNAISKRGHMYEVKINAHHDHFLDWDKPIQDQPYVMEQLIKAGVLTPEGDTSFMYNDTPRRGGDIYERLTSPLAEHLTGGDTKKHASDFLHQAGIKGIRYNDGRSTNYVVFDDKLVNVKRKYAKGGMVEDENAEETDKGYQEGRTAEGRIEGRSADKGRDQGRSGKLRTGSGGRGPGWASSVKPADAGPIVERALMVISRKAKSLR